MKKMVFTVNGVTRSFAVSPEMPQLWYLRDELHLTGTKVGCGEGLSREMGHLLSFSCFTQK